MKKKIIFVLLFVWILTLTGCSAKPKPETTVDDFFKAAKILDFESMAKYVDPSIRIDTGQMNEILNPEEVDEDTLPTSEYFIDYLKTSASKLKYQIKNTEVNENKATLTVEVSYVDSLPIFKETIGELFVQAFSMAFSGVEMTDEQMNQLFEKVLKEKIEASTESIVSKTMDIPLILIDDTWYISQTNDELLTAVTLGLNEADSIFEDSDDSDGIQGKSPIDTLNEVDNYIISDLWNDGFIEISYFLETGKGSMGQELDIDLTKQQLGRALEKKPGYDEFVNGLGNEYTDIKGVWGKLSAEADKLYEQIDDGTSEISVDLFRQYMDAFSKMVSEIE